MQYHSVFMLCLVVWNLIVFTLYGIDKSFARRGKRRIPERALLSGSVLLGGMGALLGIYLFRHKTQKTYFKIVSFFGVILCAVSLTIFFI